MTTVDLREAVKSALRAARGCGQPRWAALRGAVSPRDGLAAFDREAERFYWERPSEGRAVAAYGAVAIIETEGPERFALAARRAEEIFAGLHVAGDAEPASAGPLLVGGFAFADAAPASPVWRGFPAGRLVLPEVLVTRLQDRFHCTVVRAVDPAADVDTECRVLRQRFDEVCASPRGRPAPGVERGAPEFLATADRPHAEFGGQIAAALDAISAGDLEKVVLARSVRLEHRDGFAPRALLETLRRTYPSCASFAVGRPGAVFLGATPERLVRIEDRRVETAAVAGSAPRGRTPEEDARLGRELRENKKEQAEHAVVVRALRDTLATCCDDLTVAETPRLLRLEGIQHLETPLSGHLANGTSLLELVGRLHPTPAVAGAPRRAALDWIALHEGLDRGAYAGPIGFVDADGKGEFCVALRAAVLRGGEARLFAGAGIVSGSEPEAELRETRLKLRALLAPLLEI